MYDPITATLGQVGDIKAYNAAFGKEAFLVVRFDYPDLSIQVVLTQACTKTLTFVPHL